MLKCFAQGKQNKNEKKNPKVFSALKLFFARIVFSNFKEFFLMFCFLLNSVYVFVFGVCENPKNRLIFFVVFIL